MAVITIRNLDEELERRLALRAAGHGQSVEAEASEILRDALRESQLIPAPTNLYAAIRAVVDPLGGIELDIPRRHSIRVTPKFE